MTVQLARKNLSDLRHEHGRLTADVANLNSQLNQLQNDLPGLMATAERRPSERATIAAQLAERDIDQLQQQINRKRAALEAVTADLKIAETELKLSEQTAITNELRGIFNSIVELANQIDQSPVDPPAWDDLRTHIIRGNELYQAVGRPGQRLFSVDPMAKCRDYFSGVIAPKCEAAMGRKFSDKAPKTLADVLGLAQSKHLLFELENGRPEPEPVRGRLVESPFIDWVENRNKQPSL